jgi:hypothetical protein
MKTDYVKMDYYPVYHTKISKWYANRYVDIVRSTSGIKNDVLIKTDSLFLHSNIAFLYQI